MISLRTGLCRERGFSVLEAIIAAAILSAGIVGLQMVYAAQIQATLGIERSLEAARSQPIVRDIITQAVRQGQDQGRAALHEGGELVWQVRTKSPRRSLTSNDSASGRFDLQTVHVDYHIAEGGQRVLIDEAIVLTWHETRPILPN